ncbi:hypothetical protein [Neisseria sicca]|nr:hypothetical protein [Neisseria sicca]
MVQSASFKQTDLQTDIKGRLKTPSLQMENASPFSDDLPFSKPS